MKATFQKIPKPTGNAGVGRLHHHEIKVKGKKCGTITFDGQDNANPKGTNKWIIRLTTVDPTAPCGWRWVTMRTRFDNDNLAKNFVEESLGTINREYKLHFIHEGPQQQAA